MLCAYIYLGHAVSKSVALRFQTRRIVVRDACPRYMTLSVMLSTQLVPRRKVRMQKSNVMRILVGGVFFSGVILLVILFTM
jgi:hypothetical protein